MDQKCPKILVVWVIIYPEENEWYGNEMKEKIYVINIVEKLIKFEFSYDEYSSFYRVSVSEFWKQISGEFQVQR